MPRRRLDAPAADTDASMVVTLSRATSTTFALPTKRINTAADLATFFTSKAYVDLRIWILQLTRSCLPLPKRRLDEPPVYSDAVKAVQRLLNALSDLIDSAPPDTGPRRFGNVAFRRWMALLKENVDELINENFKSPALIELRTYLTESFGSSQRLDYGTGHELSFLAFLGSLWKLGFFVEGEEWSIVAGCINSYLGLVRRLIKTYTLEPAGSHGVWGLDDHCFIPYILGSAQLAKPTSATSPMPQEGSLDSAPDPATITSPATVNEYKHQNLYFAAIAFILEVKKGPFFEHSPYLYNISGIKDGWGKINKGMLKMYDAEVLGKFPVVQHFGFGSLWEWTDEDIGEVDTKGAIDQQADAMPTPQPLQMTSAPWTQSSTHISQSQAGFQATSAPWSRTAAPTAGSNAPSRPSNRLPLARPGRPR